MKNKNGRFHIEDRMSMMKLAITAIFAAIIFMTAIVYGNTTTARAESEVESATQSDAAEDEDVTSKGDTLSAMLAGKNICYIIAENGYMSALENNKELTSLERASVFDHLSYKKYTIQMNHLNPIKPRYKDVTDPNSPLMGIDKIPEDMTEEEQVPDQSNELVELDASEPGYKTNETTKTDLETEESSK